MHTKKTMTEKALAANRRNAERSTGPKNTKAVAQNSFRHGFLARGLAFTTTEQEEEFRGLLTDLECACEPDGAVEELLVEQIASSLWRMRRAMEWEERENDTRPKTTKYFIGALAEKAREIPLFSSAPDTGSVVHAGWACHEISVRSGATHSDDEDPGLISDSSSHVGQLSVEAKLSSPMELAMRYYTAAERSFYRALQTLRNLRRI